MHAPPERILAAACTTATRAPMANRFVFGDSSFTVSQCRVPPTWLRSNRTGPLLLATTMSIAPSLSMSPNAAPRLISST